jgi:hypothetical protein
MVLKIVRTIDKNIVTFSNFFGSFEIETFADSFYFNIGVQLQQTFPPRFNFQLACMFRIVHDLPLEIGNIHKIIIY